MKAHEKDWEHRIDMIEVRLNGLKAFCENLQAQIETLREIQASAERHQTTELRKLEERLSQHL